MDEGVGYREQRRGVSQDRAYCGCHRPHVHTIHIDAAPRWINEGGRGMAVTALMRLPLAPFVTR
jgi:hypothetical protein